MEYKHMLEPEEYRRIMEWMDCAYAPPGFVQINYFYDTDTYDLHQDDVTLRVRQLEGRLLCQCKFESTATGDRDVKARTELEREVPVLPRIINPGEWFDHPRIRALPPVSLLGTLVTERRVHDVEPGVQVMLDRSHYMGHTDWELEIEFDEDKEARARYWRSRLYTGTSRVEGKRARFIESHCRIYV